MNQSETTTTTTVRRQILVNAPIGEAFKVFTERFGDFKPREHNLLRAAIAETVFEPRLAVHHEHLELRQRLGTTA